MKVKINYLDNNFSGKEIVFFFLLYFSLILGFVFDENSTGGAYVDYKNQKNITSEFAKNFLFTLFNYDSFSSRHSPLLMMILSIFEKFNLNDYVIRLIHLHGCLLLPIIFYKILCEKFSIKNKTPFLILCSLIFLSPTFRSLSIWPDSRILGVTFFSLSILFFLKFNKTDKIKYFFLNIFSYTLASYLSPNFALFSIFYFYKFFLEKKINYQLLVYFVFLNVLLSIPAIYYIFFLEINFINKSAGIGFSKGDNIIFLNFYNTILISFSIFFFYIFPFTKIRIIEIFNDLNLKKIFLSIIIFIILVSNFDYIYEVSGGGIFFKISNAIFGNNYFFYAVGFISIIFIISNICFDKTNVLLFIVILLNNPQYTIYHKYFDPFLLICFFSLFNFKVNLNNLLIKKNILIIYLYFGIFLFISMIKSLWIT